MSPPAEPRKAGPRRWRGVLILLGLILAILSPFGTIPAIVMGPVRFLENARFSPTLLGTALFFGAMGGIVILGLRWSRATERRGRVPFLILALLLALFSTSILSAAAVHQVGWLVRSDQPLGVSTWSAPFDFRQMCHTLEGFEAASTAPETQYQAYRLAITLSEPYRGKRWKFDPDEHALYLATASATSTSTVVVGIVRGVPTAVCVDTLVEEVPEDYLSHLRFSRTATTS